MDVLQEILKWSSSRPTWQRDALRRLITTGDLDQSDVTDLTGLCKAAHGLAEQRDSEPLEDLHIPKQESSIGSVTLKKLSHHGGVNALALDQTIEFGPGLTAIYGANASGKSGYTRILKRACRARGAEEILGNVLVQSAPGRPAATISYAVNGDDDEFPWKDQTDVDGVLENVSVFDRHCAAIYLAEKTDVAFRPLGLDLFDKLSRACGAVKAALEAERDVLAERKKQVPELPEGTSAERLTSNLTSLTKPDDVRKLGTLSEDEKNRLRRLRKLAGDIEAGEASRTSRSLELRAQRLSNLVSHLDDIQSHVSDSALTSDFKMQTSVRELRGTIAESKQESFPPELLEGSGGDIWRVLWEAAREFSSAEAYPGVSFPFTHDDAR